MNKKNLIKTIGFKELKNFLLKKNNMNTTAELTLQATRNYAKRQYTWFRHQFSANIIFKETYEKKNKKYFLKDGVNFWAKSDKDAELYRKKINEKLDKLKNLNK